MQIKQILEVTIDDYGMAGEGIAHVDTFTVFVPSALVGERVKVQVVNIKRGGVYAKIIKLIEPSEQRQAPKCEVFGKCGGCTMQHLTRETELQIKQRNVMNCFRKNARISIDLPEIITAPERYGYRNKVALPFKQVRGQVTMGMYRPDSHNLVPIVECPLNDGFEKILIDVFTKYANKYNVSAYDEDTGRGILRHLVARKLDGVVSIVVVVNSYSLPYSKELIALLSQELPAFSLGFSSNKKRNNVILGDTVTTIYGDTTLSTVVNGIKCEIHPLAFFQVNNDARDLAYERIISYVEEGATVIDAYSGTGIMTAQIAKKASAVYGVEICPEAVANAERIAAVNGLSSKITHVLGDAAEKIPQLLATLPNDVTVVIDPPRQGIAASLIPILADSKIKKIIYLSCNPATLSRDVSLLSSCYTLTSCSLIDMFPLTGNVETLICLSKKS